MAPLNLGVNLGLDLEPILLNQIGPLVTLSSIVIAKPQIKFVLFRKVYDFFKNKKLLISFAIKKFNVTYKEKL